MPTLIRSSCFETNSSSSHSISLGDKTKDFVKDTLLPDSQGRIVFICDKVFGWDYFKYNDAYTKALYMFMQYAAWPELFLKLAKYVLAHTGATSLVFQVLKSPESTTIIVDGNTTEQDLINANHDPIAISTIDYQSLCYYDADKKNFKVNHLVFSSINTDCEALGHFLWNKNSWLFGGNDNSEVPKAFYDVPVYTADAVVV